MSANLIKRLRQHAERGYSIGAEAADEIERLHVRSDTAAAQIVAMAEDADRWRARYKLLGGMSNEQFNDVFKLHIRTGKPFDDIIDELMPFAGESPK